LSFGREKIPFTIVLLHFRASFYTIQDESDLTAMNIQQCRQPVPKIEMLSSFHPYWNTDHQHDSTIYSSQKNSQELIADEFQMLSDKMQ